jgi:hypothetical protein
METFKEWFEQRFGGSEELPLNLYSEIHLKICQIIYEQEIAYQEYVEHVKHQKIFRDGFK